MVLHNMLFFGWRSTIYGAEDVSTGQWVHVAVTFSENTSSGEASFVAGRNENTVKLDGSSGYVSLSSGIESSFSVLTIATWLYINTQVTWARVFDFGTGTNVFESSGRLVTLSVGDIKLCHQLTMSGATASW
jgi:hypothetical protein